MNIWVIGRNYPTKENNMRGSFELEQAKMLAKQGHQVIYLACVFHPFKKIRKWGYTTWEEHGVTICCYSMFYLPERIKIHGRLLKEWCWKKLLQRTGEQCGLPDVIHIHYPAMLAEPGVLEQYRTQGIKIVATEHWSKVLLQELKPYEILRLQWMMEYCHVVAAVGEPLAESMQKLTGSSQAIAVVPNVLNPVFSPVVKSGADGTFRFITVGRLVKLRQYDRVILTFDHLFHGREDVSLTVVGDGEEEKRLQKLIDSLGASNVYLAGMKSREECAALVQQSDCLICYSAYETFGVPVIEAWACGVPVIVSEHLGFPEAAGNVRLSIHADAQNADSLEIAMHRIMDEYDEFDPIRIGDYAKTNYSEDVIYTRLMSLYEG